jgi:hypothetical protein
MTSRGSGLFLELAFVLTKYPRKDREDLVNALKNENSRQRLLEMFNAVLSIASNAARSSDTPRTNKSLKHRDSGALFERREHTFEQKKPPVKRNLSKKKMIPKKERPSGEYKDWARIIMGRHGREK